MDTVVYLILHAEVLSKKNTQYLNAEETLPSFSLLSISGEEEAKNLSLKEELQQLNAVYSASSVSCIGTSKYIAKENNQIILVDERLNERKIGHLDGMTMRDFHREQVRNFDFKLKGGESLNETKKRMTEAMKNILMFETGNRIAIVSHSTSLTCLLSAWCTVGRNYDEDVILSYDGQTIVDGHWVYPSVFKVVFDGMNVKSITYLENL